MKALAVVVILGALFICLLASGGLYQRKYTGLGTVAVWAGIIDILALVIMVAVKYL